MDVTVRTYTPPAPQSESVPDDHTPSNFGSESQADGTEPIEVFEQSGKNIVLEALGIDDSDNHLPADDNDNLGEVKQYVFDIIKKSGESPTMGAFKRTLNDIKADMGLTDITEPSVVLDRIGGVVKAWKNISFVSDPHQKRSIFMKLSRASSSSEMNKIVFEAMENYHVWK